MFFLLGLKLDPVTPRDTERGRIADDPTSIADRFGRKAAFYTLWVALVAAVAFESFGRTWQTWLCAKLFSGFGVGSVQVCSFPHPHFDTD